MSTSTTFSVNKSARGPVLSDPERSRRRVEGFTLVELLVVISIIAILSVIGITIFTGVQKNARDTRRKGDIDAIAKAMEAQYGKFSTGQYAGLCQVSSTSTYDCSQWFTGGSIPADPTGTVPYHGCDSSIPQHNPVCQGTSAAEVDAIRNGFFDNRPDWMVCASLEAGGKYCRRNQQ